MAIVRDLFTGLDAAKLLSRLMLVMGAAPILAPTLGGIVLNWTQWRGVFVVLAAIGVTGPVWLLVLGFAGHGIKDLWQHRTQYVATTRWWPPFCMVVDWVVAAALVLLAVLGVRLR